MRKINDTELEEMVIRYLTDTLNECSKKTEKAKVLKLDVNEIYDRTATTRGLLGFVINMDTCMSLMSDGDKRGFFNEATKKKQQEKAKILRDAYDDCANTIKKFVSKLEAYYEIEPCEDINEAPLTETAAMQSSVENPCDLKEVPVPEETTPVTVSKSDDVKDDFWTDEMLERLVAAIDRYNAEHKEETDNGDEWADDGKLKINFGD